ncbi:MAG: bifunctional phosphopantothenoylcysteine decarboxylase/phosphopantothenate--cysteine ligase CoaBC [Acidilobaceae archaeon]
MTVTYEFEHPASDIKGSINRYLEGKQIIVGLTGSVAAYRTVDLIRWFLRRSASVVPFATSEALRYVGPDLLEWASGVRPVSELGGQTEHISIVKMSHALVMAPATLSSLSKLAYGIADNPVVLAALSALGYEKPIVVAPALHSSLASIPQYRDVVVKLNEQGVTIIPPRTEGSRLVMEDPAIIGRVTATLACRGKDARGLRILVTGGATREWVDSIRFLTNASSGKMALEIALEAWARGANVDLVIGASSIKPPTFLNPLSVETTKEMADVVARLTETKEYDAIISAAAPIDFEVEPKYENVKLSSSSEVLIKLKPTIKVLNSIKQKPKVLVVFTATPREDLEGLSEAGLEKLSKYEADIVIANTAYKTVKGFGTEDLNVLMIWKDKTMRYLGYVHKEVLARHVVDEVVKTVKRKTQ